MYVPAHNAMPLDEATAILEQVRLADLVTVDPATLAPASTPLPMIHRPSADGFGSLEAHLARPNRQWEHTEHPALVILRGGDAYVNPTWYPTYRDGANAVPTWNYEVVQVTGRLVAHDDVEWLDGHVRRLSERFDPEFDLDRNEARVNAGMLRAIVGVELIIDGVVGKSKLSQNRSTADIVGVAEALDADARGDLADRMREVSLPHAQAREAAVHNAQQRRSHH
ncbi:MAG TPA: FMN-binding negative transcriptional regulator [Tessaracoccus flavescens]|uniref:FMN-binding negative transcriptional regulator n=1 Tax=Tessaracoccus flavescens TaxID=399497 RepID=A0A921EMZ4_9ACTN|nr:FMN-binding negative transcriptional regulator [Tessaracoccus flavescens]